MCRRSWLALVSFLLMETLTAQLVFIPDTNLRNWFNSYSPGCVDASGWFDPQDPGIQADTTFIISPEGWWDMTGFDAIPNCRRLIMGCQSISSSLQVLKAFPDSVRHLEIEDHGALDSLLNLPPLLRTLWVRSTTVTVLDTLPPGLRHLDFTNVPYLDSIPQLPSTLKTFSADLMAQLTHVPMIPAGCETVRLMGCPLLAQLPVIAPGVRQLWLKGLPMISGLGMLPDSLRDLRLENSGFQGQLPALPDGCTNLYLDMLPQLTSVGPLNVGLEALGVTDCPLVDSLPDPLPAGLHSMDIILCPALICLPLLHDSMSIYIGFSGVNCLPNIPQNDFDVTPSWLADRPCSIFRPACMSNSISGSTFVDLNADGIHDPNEPVAAGTLVSILPDIGVVVSDQMGRYAVQAAPGAYVIEPVADPMVMSVSPPSHSAQLVLPTDMDSLNDFGLVLVPGVQDLRATVVMDYAWSGFATNVWVTVKNEGSTTVNASALLELDTLCAVITSDPAPTSVSGQTLEWSIGPMSAGQVFFAHLVVETMIVPFGTPVTHHAMAMPLAGDMDPSDNEDVHNDVVVGSYDPNDKTVLPVELSPSEVIDGHRVEYLIRFQNTGTFPAVDVVVTDTLDMALDITEIEVLAASHAMDWTVQGRLVGFVFNGIMLPDSASDGPGSNGFVLFSIALDDSVLNGDCVANMASIYFDFNEPILTEPAVVCVQEPTSMELLEKEDVVVYPQPARDRIFINYGGRVASLVVSDLLGRMVYQNNSSWEGSQEVDLSHLPSGTYVLDLRSNERSFRTTIIKL